MSFEKTLLYWLVSIVWCKSELHHAHMQVQFAFILSQPHFQTRIGQRRGEGRRRESSFLTLCKASLPSVQPCINAIFKFVSALQLWFWKSGVAYNPVKRQWSLFSVIFNYCAFLFVISGMELNARWEYRPWQIMLEILPVFGEYEFCLLHTGSSRCQTQWVLWCQWRVILVRWWLWLVEIYVMWTGRQVWTLPSKHC